MRKTFLLSVFIAITTLASAQDTGTAAPTVDPKVLKAAATTDHAGEWMVVKKGKTYAIINGKEQLLKRDIPLDNGSTLKTNGEVIMKDGSKVLIKEDERINRLGDIGKLPDSTAKKVTKVPEPPPAPVTK
jgi:photosystem II stability/assembly factor-like uncharacterized protein